MTAVSIRPAALCGKGLIPLVLIACPPPLWAADATALPPVFVTAARAAQPLTNVLADVRVIDAEQIRAAGAATLTELLQSFGGVEIAASGGRGQTSGVFMRGSNANHVVLLIDGIRIQSASAGTNAFETIPLEQIERIEVLRGPASSLYGADAIGGVIQIFTRSGAMNAANGLQGRVSAGTWKTREASGAVSRSWGATRVGVTAGYSDSRGFSATTASNFSFDPDPDGTRNRNLGLQIDHDWAAGQSVRLHALQSDSAVDFDCFGSSGDLNHQRIASTSLESRNRLAPDWQGVLRLARGSDDIVSRNGACASRFRTDQDQASWQNDVTLAAGQLILGLEARRERLDSDTSFTATTRRTASAFSSFGATLEAHSAQASLRYDRSDQFGGRASGSLAYAWQTSADWRFGAAAGNAFKAPSFNDLYFPFIDFGGGFTFVGNPQLRPERARSVEVSTRYQVRGLQADLTLFQNRIRDLIAVDSTASTVVNVDSARIRGATLNGNYSAEGWSVRFDVTRQNPIDEVRGTQLARRARVFGSAGVTATPGAWRLGIESVASGARFDSLGNAPQSRLGGYAVFNLHAGYALSREWSVSARLNNAAEKAYELVQAYQTPRRNAMVALEYAAR
jgi:vitamin B12 transporter